MNTMEQEFATVLAEINFEYMESLKAMTEMLDAMADLLSVNHKDATTALFVVDRMRQTSAKTKRIIVQHTAGIPIE